MRKNLLKIFALAIVISTLFSCASITASAQDYFSVSVKKGDTACSLCKENGLDYQSAKNIIMVINDMTKESDLGNLSAGTTLKLPTSGAVKSSIITEDTIKFYVIPYVIQKGDSIAKVYNLWGLRFESYQEYIKSLNGKDDLDLLFVGDIYLLPTTVGNVKTDIYTVVMSHTVKSGETINDICSAYDISYKDNKKKLENYNLGADLTKLTVGSEVLIPLI